MAFSNSSAPRTTILSPSATPERISVRSRFWRPTFTARRLSTFGSVSTKTTLVAPSETTASVGTVTSRSEARGAKTASTNSFGRSSSRVFFTRMRTGTV